MTVNVETLTHPHRYLVTITGAQISSTADPSGAPLVGPKAARHFGLLMARSTLLEQVKRIEDEITGESERG